LSDGNAIYPDHLWLVSGTGLNVLPEEFEKKLTPITMLMRLSERNGDCACGHSLQLSATHPSDADDVTREEQLVHANFALVRLMRR